MTKTLLRSFAIVVTMLSAISSFAADSGSKKFDEMGEYITRTQQFISYEWSKSPVYNPELKAPVVDMKVMIDPKGRILTYEFISESNDAAFNTACETFMKKLGDLPKPPDLSWHRIMEEGLLFRFTPNLLKFKIREIQNFVGCQTEKDYVKKGYKYMLYKSTNDKAYVDRFSKEMRKNAELYRGDFRRIYKQLTGRERSIYAILGLIIAQDGSVKQVEMVCPSSAPVYGEILLKRLKDVEKVEPPPADMLNKNNELLLLWSSFHYLK